MRERRLYVRHPIVRRGGCLAIEIAFMDVPPYIQCSDRDQRTESLTVKAGTQDITYTTPRLVNIAAPLVYHTNQLRPTFGETKHSVPVRQSTHPSS